MAWLQRDRRLRPQRYSLAAVADAADAEHHVGQRLDGRAALHEGARNAALEDVRLVASGSFLRQAADEALKILQAACESSRRVAPRSLAHLGSVAAVARR